MAVLVSDNVETGGRLVNRIWEQGISLEKAGKIALQCGS
jgi:hypothetical protein